MNIHISEEYCRTLGGEEHEMAYSGGGMGGGIGGGMATLWNQQRSLRYLREGKPDISHTLALVWKSLSVYRFFLLAAHYSGWVRTI